MMKTRPVAVTAASLLGLGMLGIAPAGAQEPTLGVSPASGPPGTTVTVSGDEPCLGPDDVGDIVPGTSAEIAIGDADATIGTGSSSVGLDGSWGPVTVETDPEAEPGDYIVTARCLLGPVLIVDLGGGNFTVEGDDPGDPDDPDDPDDPGPGDGPGDGGNLPGPGGDSDGGPDDVGVDADAEGAGEGEGDGEGAPAPADPAPPINGDADYTG